MRHALRFRLVAVVLVLSFFIEGDGPTFGAKLGSLAHCVSNRATRNRLVFASLTMFRSHSVFHASILYGAESNPRYGSHRLHIERTAGRQEPLAREITFFFLEDIPFILNPIPRRRWEEICLCATTVSNR